MCLLSQTTELKLEAEPGRDKFKQCLFGTVFYQFKVFFALCHYSGMGYTFLTSGPVRGPEVRIVLFCKMFGKIVLFC